MSVDVSRHGYAAQPYSLLRLTIAIETVASANGSPSILSMLIVRIPFVLRPLSIPPFILRRDGEWSDPYDGIGKIGRATARSSRERY